MQQIFLTVKQFALNIIFLNMYKYNSIHLNNLKAMSGLSTRVCKVNSLNLNLDTYFM